MVMPSLSFLAVRIEKCQQTLIFCYPFFDGVAPIQLLVVRIEKCQQTPCRFVAYDGFLSRLSFIAFWCSLHFWSPHFGNNMHHSLGDFLSLRSCLLGCIGNQLPLTVFDEFHFV